MSYFVIPIIVFVILFVVLGPLRCYIEGGNWRSDILPIGGFALLCAMLSFLGMLAFDKSNEIQSKKQNAKEKITLYSSDGKIIKTYISEGSSEWWAGGEISFHDIATKKRCVLNGTYIIESLE